MAGYIGNYPTAVPLTSADIQDGTIGIADLSATGTKDSTTFLRGDNTFAQAGLNGWSEDGANNNLLPASASAGIYLGVTSATASNLLDDYEEGTYEPVVIDSNESATITVSSTNKYLSYTKVGRLVHVQGFISIIGVSGTWSGGLQISLPFTSASLDGYAGGSVLSVVTYNVDFTTGTSPTFLVGQGQAYAILRTSGDNISYGYGRPASDGQVYVSGTYFSA